MEHALMDDSLMDDTEVLGWDRSLPRRRLVGKTAPPAKALACSTLGEISTTAPLHVSRVICWCVAMY
eukprot:6480348-Amphidinium_carterae.2